MQLKNIKMKAHKLFEEFPPVSSEEWRKKIDIDLKGADFDRKLVWKTIEGFKVQPYYRLDDVQKNPLIDLEPNQFPYIRGQKTESNDWLIRQDFLVKNVDDSNKEVLDALMKGVTSINLIIKELKLNSQTDFDRLIRGIELTAVEINFCSSDSNVDLISMLANYIDKNNIDASKVYGSFNVDALAWITMGGKCEHSTMDEAYTRVSELIVFAEKKLPNFHILGINGRIFPNAGSSIVQELAFSLAMANQYLEKLSDKIDIDSILKHMRFNIGISSNYFMEVAKVRALRLLWSKLAEAYQPKNIENTKVFIHAINSNWNKTVFDPYVNVLRSTTESMSAVIGGIDSLTVNPFNTVYQDTDTISKRIARNTQIILKEEAYFDKVADPAAGSYYIEELTSSLIEKSWELFLNIEEKGGYYKCIEDNYIQNLISEMAQQRDMQIASRREILLGTNQYPNTEEKMSDKVFDKKETVQKNGNIEPIKPYRGAEAFEALRFEVEKAEKTPLVYMFTYGNLTMRKARAQFAGNFFGCAGYKIQDNPGFKTVEEGIDAVKNAKPEIIVICSSDDEYIDIVPKIQEEVGKDTLVVIAGNPKESIEALKAVGIKYFVHVKTNLLETLQSVNKEIS